MSHAYLYLLVFPEIAALKIGKANNVHARVRELRRDFGPADYDASYQLHAQQHVVFRLEKALLSMLCEHQHPQRFHGVGATEIVTLNALGPALRHLEIFAPGAVQKGIPRPGPHHVTVAHRTAVAHRVTVAQPTDPSAALTYYPTSSNKLMRATLEIALEQRLSPDDAYDAAVEKLRPLLAGATSRREPISHVRQSILEVAKVYLSEASREDTHEARWANMELKFGLAKEHRERIWRSTCPHRLKGFCQACTDFRDEDDDGPAPPPRAKRS